MTIRAVIFDRDGVLTHFDAAAAVAFFQPLLPISLGELAAIWQRWGHAQGFPRTLAEEARFFQEFWDHVGDFCQLAPAQREQLHQVDYTHFMRAFNDARSALTVARAYNCHTGVLSNFSLASLEPSLHAVGLLDLIDVACAATVIGAAKPQSAAYLAVIQALGVTPQECLFLDDEEPCVVGAQAVGMHAYLVDRTRTEHGLADGIVCNLSILETLLHQSPEQGL